ncbi:histone-lysine N-methyltransferase SETMAR [Elysia marginata]|uniref:Histone-lysine N-methyltransferase SETMAR n=1 Tax=Elysia marginata TaxID=1093978 RepID=A0AAV4HW67_9GAST|nr:histone-lysine N-methyltransferase SETMAR [Elysia marginata]
MRQDCPVPLSAVGLYIFHMFQTWDRTAPGQSHRSAVGALRQLELTTLPHYTYSSDLVPSDYYLFPQLKKYLKGQHYNNDKEVIADGAVGSS